MAQWAPNMLHVSFANLTAQGIRPLVERLQDRFGLGVCLGLKSRTPKKSSKRGGDSVNGIAPAIRVDVRSQPREMRWITCNADWDVETKFGYYPNPLYHNSKSGVPFRCSTSPYSPLY